MFKMVLKMSSLINNNISDILKDIQKIDDDNDKSNSNNQQFCNLR